MWMGKEGWDRDLPKCTYASPKAPVLKTPVLVVLPSNPPLKPFPGKGNAFIFHHDSPLLKQQIERFPAKAHIKTIINLLAFTWFSCCAWSWIMVRVGRGRNLIFKRRTPPPLPPVDFCDLCGNKLLKSFKRELAVWNVVSWLPSGATSLRSTPGFTRRPGSSQVLPTNEHIRTSRAKASWPVQDSSHWQSSLSSSPPAWSRLSQCRIAILGSFSRSSFLYPLLLQVSHVQHGLKSLICPVTSALSLPQVFPAPKLLHFSFCLGVCFLQDPNWHLFLFF